MDDWSRWISTDHATGLPAVMTDAPAAAPAAAPAPDPGLSFSSAQPAPPAKSTGTAALPPEADVLYSRVRKAEGTAAGDGMVVYGGDPFKPGKEHPGDAAVRQGPQGKTHAAGPGQWEPDTWNGLKPEFEKRFGRAPDFSSQDDQKAMVWLNAAKIYGGDDKLRADLAADKLDTKRLAAQWAGFGSGGVASPWATISAGKWQVDDKGIAYEQGRSNTQVVWMSPDDYLAMTPKTEAGDKRKSLLKSLDAGDAIEAIPTLDAKLEGGRVRVFDQDGRNRAAVAKQEGVDLIPVAIHGMPAEVSGRKPGPAAGAGEPAWIEDMNGALRRFDYRPVAPISSLKESRFPNDMPGVTYGSVLPVAKDNRTGDIGFAMPEMIRAPVRGAISLGEQMLGQKPFEPRNLTSDEFSAASLGASAPIAQAAAPIAREAASVAAPALDAARTGITAGAERIAEAVTPGPPGVEGFLRGVGGASAIENKARATINRRFSQDAAAGGPAPRQIAEQLQAARAAGQPMGLADVAGENVKGLLGNVAREPGPARNRVKQWAVSRLGDVDRDSPIATGIEQGISELLATGSARTEARALAEQRAAGKPLWDEAMAGGNLPPVPRQIARAYGEADRAAAKATAAYDKEAEKLAQMERRARDQAVKVPQAPTRLSTFLIRGGGLKDEGTEISYILGSARGRPGLINKTGRSLDDAAHDAWEAGYLPGAERASIDDLLNALAQDINMAPVYSELDAEMAAANEAALKANSETTRRATERPGPAGPRVTPRDLQFQRDKVADHEAARRSAEEVKSELVGVLRAAEADGTANLPGAVYSPKLGRLLKNPRVQQGIVKGYRIERDIADGEGRPLNTRDYAIVGMDAAGDPVVGAVPNMKLLAVAKEGIDAILDSSAMRDELTGRLNKEGRAVKILRDGLVGELDTLNPAYKVARDKWAGDSALISAVRDGKNFHKMSPEEIAEWFQTAGESEKDFYRLGAADTMRDDVQRRVFGGDPSKAIVNSARTRNQITPMFRSPEDAQAFLDRIRRARTMFNTPVEVLGNSKTAAREAEDLARRQGLDTAADILHGVVGAASGSHYQALRSGTNLAKRYLFPANQRVNDAIARLLIDPGIGVPMSGQELLRSMPLPKTRNAVAEMMRRGVSSYGQNRMMSGP